MVQLLMCCFNRMVQLLRSTTKMMYFVQVGHNMHDSQYSLEPLDVSSIYSEITYLCWTVQ